MYERTITFGSAGKTFSVTGWKIGWTISPQPLATAVFLTHQYIPFCVTSPLQEAVASVMEESLKNGYFEWLKKMYQEKRDKIVNILKNSPFVPIVPKGSYFVLADSSKLPKNAFKGSFAQKDWNVCSWLTTEIGVAAIPPSAFYSKEHQELGANIVRFCFCKKDSVLEEAGNRLQKIKSN